MNKCKADNLLFVNSPYKVLIYGSNPCRKLVHISCSNTLRLNRIKKPYDADTCYCLDQYIYLKKREKSSLYETIT